MKSIENADDFDPSEFGKKILTGYLLPSFGARSKTEIDHLIFHALVSSGYVDPFGSNYDLARKLNLSPTRARNLILTWQLRSPEFSGDLGPRVREALSKSRFAKDGDLVSFGLESPLLREHLKALLRRQGVFADTSFSSEIIRMPTQLFIDFVEHFTPKEFKIEMKDRLIRDKQLPDNSFKGLIIGFVKNVSNNVVGKAGSVLTDSLVENLSGRFSEIQNSIFDQFFRSIFDGDSQKCISITKPDDFS